MSNELYKSTNTTKDERIAELEEYAEKTRKFFEVKCSSEQDEYVRKIYEDWLNLAKQATGEK